jgi:hypothetical protein
MKKLFTTTILFLSVSISAQNNIKFKKSEADSLLPSIISELFDAKFNKQTNEFIWKPNYAERLEFGVSFDGFLYTKIDKYLKYNNNNFSTIVAFTYVKDENGKYESCHACAPSLSLITFKLYEESENVELSYFKKFVAKIGSFGELPEVSVLQISEKDYCIKVSNEWVGHGSSYTYDHLYYEGENVLDIDTYGDNPEGSNKFHYNTTINIDKINRIITLTKIEDGISKKSKQKISIYNTEKYKFDEYYYRYIKICN